MAAPHPIQRRLWAEELVRLRRARERERYAASQRRGRIDPNPHQIDAVIFALERIPSGGCVLADEVGLGKTIEAGLIIAQVMAEGTRRVLLIVPKPLLGQWQHELYTLFALETHDGMAGPRALNGEGVFLVGREFAGTARGSKAIADADPFGLCVIDEAHEIFAAIHRRYDRDGQYREDSEEAMIAHRVKSVLGSTPKLLLTATPIQNSLAELWGLVQYVEPTGTLLGDLPTFRAVFCDGDDRQLAPGQEHELRRRVDQVCKRTLRRQAQEFLERPFVGRSALLVEYAMSPEEHSLYEDVTRYLLEPNLCAFRGRQKQLLLLGFHRRMASSLPALAASLRKVVDRLERMGAGDDEGVSTAVAFRDDLDDDELGEVEEGADDPPPDPAALAAELARVRAFVRRAESIPSDTKAEKLLEAIGMVRERGREGEGSGRVVVFTESLTTQDYLRDRLLAAGFDDRDITLFRGQNESPRAREALEIWRAEVEQTLPAYSRPTPDVAVRLALVHEFKTRSHVFISTEAGAKGLNLQFCETLINYDLPWNPQRIEQRIGRCHRYGQQRDVVVVNFSATDNAAQQLLLDILMTKLDLFGRVLDASDVVLHEPTTDAPEPLVGAVGADFQARLSRIYERARTLEEIEDELRKLREAMADQRQRYEDVVARTRQVIESHLDESVRAVFRRIQDELPLSLAELDQRLDRVLSGYLDAVGARYERRKGEGRILYSIQPATALPDGLRDGIAVAIGGASKLEDTDPLHLGHPLLAAAIAEAREATAAPRCVRFPLGTGAPVGLASRRGQRGRLVVAKLSYHGSEPVEHLVPVVLFEGEPTPLGSDEAAALLRLDPVDATDLSPVVVDPSLVDDAIEEVLFLDQGMVDDVEQQRFERSIEQIERFVDDRVMVQRRLLDATQGRFLRAQNRRDAAMGSEARDAAEQELRVVQTRLEELEAEIARLQDRDDEIYEKWRDQAHRRRYARPDVERVLDLEFVIE